jgi:hypothetical protein
MQFILLKYYVFPRRCPPRLPSIPTMLHKSFLFFLAACFWGAALVAAEHTRDGTYFRPSVFFSDLRISMGGKCVLEHVHPFAHP